MKRILIILSLISLVLSSTAQTNVYYPLPDSNAVWEVENICIYELPPYYITYSEITITGDTFILGKKYHELHEYDVNYKYYNYNDIEFQYSGGGYIGAFRNDSINKKVYFISSDNNSKESLLYDFNLKLGDTLPLSYINTSDILYLDNRVTSIDSFLIFNHYHKRFGISVNNSMQIYAYLIEGIGSTNGILSPLIPPSEVVFNLLCFSINGKAVWPDTGYCAPLKVSIKPANKPPFSLTISPNPFSTSAEITLSNNLPNADLSIHNIFGTEVLTLKNIPNHQKIQRSNLPNGIYFYTRTQKNKIIYSGKLMIL